MSSAGERGKAIAARDDSKPSFTQRLLDAIERFDNKVPYLVVIFATLIVFAIVLSHILWLMGARVSYELINPETDKLEHATTSARSLRETDDAVSQKTCSRSLNARASDDKARLGAGSDGWPVNEAARTSLGLEPNSRRKARLKLEASSKERSSAMAKIDVLMAGSESIRCASSKRWRWM